MSGDERIKPAPTVVDAVAVVAFDSLDEFADIASECADALRSAARLGDKRRCFLYAKQLSAATRAVLETVGDLVREASA
jgi:hypothetical protein